MCPKVKNFRRTNWLTAKQCLNTDDYFQTCTNQLVLKWYVCKWVSKPYLFDHGNSSFKVELSWSLVFEFLRPMYGWFGLFLSCFWIILLNLDGNMQTIMFCYVWLIDCSVLFRQSNNWNKISERMPDEVQYRNFLISGNTASLLLILNESKADHMTANFLKAVFHKFYLFYWPKWFLLSYLFSVTGENEFGSYRV